MFVAVCVAGIVLIACMMLALTACVLNKYKAQKKKDWLELHGHSGGDGGDGGGVRSRSAPLVCLSALAPAAVLVTTVDIPEQRLVWLGTTTLTQQA